MERDYEYAIFYRGKKIDGEPITRDVAKAMMLELYAKESDVEEILSLNNQEVR